MLPKGFENFPSVSASEVAYLVRLDFIYLIKPLVVGFYWRCNWTVGRSINVLTNVILFRHQNDFLMSEKSSKF